MQWSIMRVISNFILIDWSINQQIIAVLLACNTGVNQGEMVVVVL